jgi:hypothetical protein
MHLSAADEVVRKVAAFLAGEKQVAVPEAHIPNMT